MEAYYLAKIPASTISTLAKELIQIQASTLYSLNICEVKINFETTLVQGMKISLAIAKTPDDHAGSVISPRGLNSTRYACFAIVCGIAATGATGLTVLDSEYINTINGYRYLPDLRWAPLIPQGEIFVVRVDSTHTDDVLTNAQIIFRENNRF